jgi:hypothetical protein
MLNEDQLEEAEGAGDVMKIVDFLKVARDEEQAESALDAILRLSAVRGEGVEGSGAALEVSITSTVLDALDKYAGEAPVVEVALGCVKNLITALTDAHSEDVINRAAKLTIAAMIQHGDAGEPTLMEQGCLALSAMAVFSRSAAEAMEDSSVNVALDAAVESIDNERNKKYPIETKALIAAILSGS